MLDMDGSLDGYTAARYFLSPSLSPPLEGLPLTLSEISPPPEESSLPEKDERSIDRYTAAHPFPCPGAVSYTHLTLPTKA